MLDNFLDHATIRVAGAGRNVRPVLHESHGILALRAKWFQSTPQRFPNLARLLAVSPSLNRFELPRYALTQKINRLAGEFQHPINSVNSSGSSAESQAPREVADSFHPCSHFLNRASELVWVGNVDKSGR